MANNNNKLPDPPEDYAKNKITKQTTQTFSSPPCEQLTLKDNQLLEKKNCQSTQEHPHQNNPYFKARIKILLNYPEWRRKEIADLERTGDIDNRHYLDFVKDVAAEGDKYTN
jgi:phosphoenolpyruvate synthase/pyruvate phosphate dikinase